MTRRKTHIEKILALLDSEKMPVKLVWRMPKEYKECWGVHIALGRKAEVLIKQSLCKNTKVRVLIHECLHHLYPQKKHSWIWSQTDKIQSTLTDDERKKLETFLRRLK